MDAIIQWLLSSPEPWTRYRTCADLLNLPESNPQMQAEREAMIQTDQVQSMISQAVMFGTTPLKRHNDASHPIYRISTLADFGLRANDPGMQPLIQAILEHQSPEGPFQSLINVARAFGGSGLDEWSWIACDAPTLLYSLLSFGVGEDARVQRAVEHLIDLARETGWECRAAPSLGKFRGPGRKTDPCPIANVYALKALSMVPTLLNSPAASAGIDMLLRHWSASPGEKYYLFGAGRNYRKLKYPYVWYDLLHVAEVLSRFPAARQDPRFQKMTAFIGAQADENNLFRPGSIYMAWKGWSFTDKKAASPWMTFLVLRILKRASL